MKSIYIYISFSCVSEREKDSNQTMQGLFLCADTNLVHIVVGPGSAHGIDTNQKVIGKSKMEEPTSQQVLGRFILFLQTCKDQNDRIGTIYRFERGIGPMFIEK